MNSPKLEIGIQLYVVFDIPSHKVINCDSVAPFEINQADFCTQEKNKNKLLQWNNEVLKKVLTIVLLQKLHKNVDDHLEK